MHRGLTFAFIVSFSLLPFAAAHAAAALDATGASHTPQMIYPSEQVTEVSDNDIKLPPPLAAVPAIPDNLPTYGPSAKNVLAPAAKPVVVADATPAFPPSPASIANATADKTETSTVTAKPAVTAGAQLRIEHLAMVHAVKSKPAPPEKFATAKSAGTVVASSNTVDPALLTLNALHQASAADQTNFLAGRDIAENESPDESAPAISKDAEIAAGAALTPPDAAEAQMLTPMPENQNLAAQMPEPLAGPIAAPAREELAQAETDINVKAPETVEEQIAPPPPPEKKAFGAGPEKLAAIDAPRDIAPGPPIHHHSAAAAITLADEVAPSAINTMDDDDRLVAREQAALGSTMEKPVSLERVNLAVVTPSACRAYTRNIILSNGAHAHATGTACLDAGHVWRITDEHLIRSEQPLLHVRYLRALPY